MKIDPIYVYLGIAAVLFLIYYMNGHQLKDMSCNPIWKTDRDYDKVTFCTMEEALDKAEEIGCVGYHTHIQDDQTIYMACAKHSDLDPYVESNYGGYYG